MRAWAGCDSVIGRYRDREFRTREECIGSFERGLVVRAEYWIVHWRRVVRFGGCV